MFSFSGLILLGSLATAWARVPISSRAANISPVEKGLGQYLGHNGSPQWGGSKPWGSRTCSSDPDNIPNTGNIYHLQLEDVLLREWRL
jgi:hypothetical protein